MSSLHSSRITQVRGPGSLGKFTIRIVNPIVPFFAMPYFRAQRILTLARGSRVFHMLNIYIARQTLHLVILLNDLAYAEDGLNDQQMDEREVLEDELVQIEAAMKDWSAIQGFQNTHRERSSTIKTCYNHIFRKRFYFESSQDATNDATYQRLLAYDTRGVGGSNDVPEAAPSRSCDNPVTSMTSQKHGRPDTQTSTDPKIAMIKAEETSVDLQPSVPFKRTTQPPIADAFREHISSGKVVVTNFTPAFTSKYSKVYQGTLEGKTVAVKVIQATGDLHSMRRRILREITIWASLDHQNIHPFYGLASDQPFGPFGALVSPWYARGDASKFLREHCTRMSEGERITLWSGVVDGVAYLHQNNPVIIHGDLKPGNVLIDDSGRPRIYDIGLSQVFLDETDSGLMETSEYIGTERHLAPELVTSEFNVCPTTLSDVYAVGCLGLEFVYLQRPYSHRINNVRGHITDDLRRGIPPAADPPEPWSQAWLLLRSCWNQKPELRPSASILVQSLRHLSDALPAAIFPMRDSRDQKSQDDTEKRQLEELEGKTGILGAEHLDTITVALNLAATYRQQGRWNDAEKLGTDVLEKRTRILGAEHLDTISAAAGLASTYYIQGRWNDAEKLGLEVLEKRTMIQGGQHSDTITAAGDLAATYHRQGRLNKAEELERYYSLKSPSM